MRMISVLYFLKRTYVSYACFI